MALAKAFPDTYMYELHEPSSVSPPLMTFTLQPLPSSRHLTSQHVLSLSLRLSGLGLPLPAAGLRAAVSGALAPLLASPERERGQRRGRALRRGPGGGERSGEHPPALRPAVQKQGGGSQRRRRKRQQRQKLRRTSRPCHAVAEQFFRGGEATHAPSVHS